jgi:hypothetical protein
MNNMKYLASVSLLVFFLLPVAWGQDPDVFESTPRQVLNNGLDLLGVTAPEEM